MGWGSHTRWGGGGQLPEFHLTPTVNSHVVIAKAGRPQVGGVPIKAIPTAHFGASRIAPSSRITSPLSMSFSMMCLTSLA